MLDIKVIRENPQYVKDALLKRQHDYSAEIDRVLELDNQRKALILKAETMKASQNEATKKIPAMKKAGEDTTELFAQLKTLSDEIKAIDPQIREVEEELRMQILYLPNIPNESIPVGRDDQDNMEVRRWGEPTKFDFDFKPHWEVGSALGILDPDTAAKVTGARFHFLRGQGSRLERAIYNFFLDTHTEKSGYFEIYPPFMANRASMTGTGQLPKFEEDAFKVSDNYFLIPTAEVPVTNMHRDETLDGSKLPLKYCAYSACFRAEAGSAGRDTRGLIRQHQFDKVELVKFVKPETSYDELESLTRDAEKVLQLLGLPYRVVCLCTGDIGMCSAKTYDIEVWMPSYNRYVEISSCSNFVDYQARRANIKYRDSAGDKPRFVHTLNAVCHLLNRGI